MKRRVRLVLIALLELVWIVISLGFFVVFVWGSVQSFGLLGIFTGVLLGTLTTAGVAGLVFLLVEIYYTLRSIEHFLDEVSEVKSILAKLARIDYQIYEMFYEQFYGGSHNSVSGVDAVDSAHSVSETVTKY